MFKLFKVYMCYIFFLTSWEENWLVNLFTDKHLDFDVKGTRG